VNSYVLLVNPPYPRRTGSGSMPPIGLCYLASSLLRLGVPVEISDLAAAFPGFNYAEFPDYRRRLADAIEAHLTPAPALVGVGPLVTATLEPTKAIVELIRKHCHAKIVLGGPLCAVPGIGSVVGDFLPCDYYVAGDGETPVSEIWKAISMHREPQSGFGIGAAGSREPEPFREASLDLLPLPARELLTATYTLSARRSPVQFPGRTTAAFLSRGCPYSCTFCAAPVASGKILRRLSDERVVEELSRCADQGFSNIVFYDDCLFIESPDLDSKVLNFAAAVSASRWHGAFQLELRCDTVAALSNGSFPALRRVGCVQINMGLEKGRQPQLDRLNKQLSPATATRAVKRLSDTGIRTAGTFIVGGPGETMDDLRHSLGFAQSLPLDFAQFNPLAVYPGTYLFTQVFGADAAKNWLPLCLNRELAPWGDILWRSAELPLSLILGEIRAAYSQFYTQDRLDRVCERMPDLDRASLTAAYRMLANERAPDWPGRDRLANERPSIC